MRRVRRPHVGLSPEVRGSRCCYNWASATQRATTISAGALPRCLLQVLVLRMPSASSVHPTPLLDSKTPPSKETSDGSVPTVRNVAFLSCCTPYTGLKQVSISTPRKFVPSLRSTSLLTMPPNADNRSAGAHPHLPMKMLSKTERQIHAASSNIYTDDFDHFRQSVIQKKCSPDIVFSHAHRSEGHPHPVNLRDQLALCKDGSPESLLNFSPAMKRTHLHFAISNGDVLQLYECIRLGANVDARDATGSSPLLHALRIVEHMRQLGAERSHAPITQSTKTLIAMTTILVEHHADVAISVDGQTPLLYACKARVWPLISLLLRHGARPASPNHGIYPGFHTLHESELFAQLLDRSGDHITRPPRLCPCLSGKTVAACHGESPQPYPDHFLCTCGSDKVYRRCCKRRNFEWSETWDPSLGRLVTTKRFKTLEELGYGRHPEVIPESHKSELPSPGVISILARWCPLIEEDMADYGLIDPAVAYAMRRTSLGRGGFRVPLMCVSSQRWSSSSCSWPP